MKKISISANRLPAVFLLGEAEKILMF